MSLEKLVWGQEVQKEFTVAIKGVDHKFVMRSLQTEDTLEMDLNLMSVEKPSTPDILKDAVEMLSRSIVSIDDAAPDSPAETKTFLLKRTQTADIFALLEKFQSLSEEIAAEVKN